MAVLAEKKKLTLEIPALLLEGDDAPSAQPGGPGSRYALGLPATPTAGAGEELVLPESYGTRKVWLVPRDPQWLYAHWDIESAQQAEYNKLSRDGHLILRVFDAGALLVPVTEIHVHPESRSWFAHVGRGGGSYFAVLGFRDRTGEWIEVSRSGSVGTPPDSLSEEVEAQFVTISTDGSLSPAKEAQAAAEAANRETRGGATLDQAAPPAATEGGASVESFTPAPPPVQTVAEVIEVVRDYLAGEPELRQAIDRVCETGHPQLPEKIQLPPPEEFVHWTAEQQEALAQVISMEAVREVWAGSHPSSIAVTEMMESQRRKELASLSALPEKAPVAPAVGAAGAISSPQGGAPGERAFWFNVNAELVIYGATEPAATVVIGGRPIKLRRDGTFSYRFALPDGWYGLPISATSSDGEETRSASLKFMRETEYLGDVGAHPQDASLKTPDPEHTG